MRKHWKKITYVCFFANGIQLLTQKKIQARHAYLYLGNTQISVD